MKMLISPKIAIGLSYTLSPFAAPTQVNPSSKSEIYESRLAASLGRQEDFEHQDKTKPRAFLGTLSSQNSGC
jgi:hypothetical protein